MYYGIGLQTPRGSGTNGYIQTSKFSVKARPLKSEPREFAYGQGQSGVSRKANKDILEHDRKRQIELKVTQLEDDLLEQGISLEEIAERVEVSRKVFEAFSPENDTNTSAKVSETQTHQIAAKKEKQLDVMKAALGIEDIKEGEAFDRELQEQRKQERIIAREDKERERKKNQMELEKEERQKENEAKKKEKEEAKQKKREERERKEAEELAGEKAEEEKGAAKRKKRGEERAELERLERAKAEERKAEREPRRDEERRVEKEHGATRMRGDIASVGEGRRVTRRMLKMRGNAGGTTRRGDSKRSHVGTTMRGDIARVGEGRRETRTMSKMRGKLQGAVERRILIYPGNMFDVHWTRII